MAIHNDISDPVKLMYAIITGNNGSDLSIPNDDWMLALNTLSQCGVVDEVDFQMYKNIVRNMVEFHKHYK